jgi:formate transporter
MDSIKPQQIVSNLIEIGTYKSELSIKNILIRSFLSGAFLAYATVLAFVTEVQTSYGVLGALAFPVGFVMINLLGLELVTGNFASLPMSLMEKKTTLHKMLTNWIWAYSGNVVGSVFVGFLFYVYLTQGGTQYELPLVQKIIHSGEAKTIAYKQAGSMGLVFVFIKAVLCNWMVTLGIVMGACSSSTSGRIMAMWLPVFTFFTLGLEHCVVNMFVIPTSIMMNASVSLSDWWLWNQIPATIGNFVGGFVFTGLLLHITYSKK